MRVLRQAYFVPATSDRPIKLGPAAAAVAITMVLAVLWLGIAPNLVWDVTREAIGALISIR
jgi:NADH:ubiquinone oxidoreductase subunit 2 (subunit N)